MLVRIFEKKNCKELLLKSPLSCDVSQDKNGRDGSGSADASGFSGEAGDCAGCSARGRIGHCLQINQGSR